MAAALKHPLIRVFPDGVEVKLVGQCTESGGGGTKYALQRALLAQNLVAGCYLVSTCSLHNLQTMLRSALTTVMGKGGQYISGLYFTNMLGVLVIV